MFAIAALFTLLHSSISTLADRVSHDDEGAAMVEYGLLVALIAVVVMVALTPLGQGIQNLFNDVNANLPASGTTAS